MRLNLRKLNSVVATNLKLAEDPGSHIPVPSHPPHRLRTPTATGHESASGPWHGRSPHKRGQGGQAQATELWPPPC
eukprot:3945678-Alexandrium_andersonii.AAC.1